LPVAGGGKDAEHERSFLKLIDRGKKTWYSVFYSDPSRRRGDDQGEAGSAISWKGYFLSSNLESNLLGEHDDGRDQKNGGGGS